MSRTPNWEQMFDKRSFCGTCGEDVTFDNCECRADIPDYEDMEDHDDY